MKKPRIEVREYRNSKTGELYRPPYKFRLDLRAFERGCKFFKTRAEADAEATRQKTLLERHSREAIGLSQREMSDFIEAKRSARMAALNFCSDLRNILAIFCQDFGKRPIAGITVEKLEKVASRATWLTKDPC